MKIIEKVKDESWLHDVTADVAVPLEITLRGDTATVEYYKSAEWLKDELLRLFMKDESTLFSASALSWIAEKFGEFLRGYGFILSPDSKEYYLNYTITGTQCGILPEVKRLFGYENYNDLTGTDVVGLCESGYIVYGAVVENNIVAVANTGEPVGAAAEPEVEIGVDTASEYRRRGFGKSCVAALINELSERGYVSVYECASGNTASIRLIESLGGTHLYKKIYAVGFREQ